MIFEAFDRHVEINRPRAVNDQGNAGPQFGKSGSSKAEIWLTKVRRYSNDLVYLIE
jgi:hypothetical protein